MDFEYKVFKLCFFQDKFSFLDWENFFRRSFEIVEHKLPADTVVLVDLAYLQVNCQKTPLSLLTWLLSSR